MMKLTAVATAAFLVAGVPVFAQNGGPISAALKRESARLARSVAPQTAPAGWEKVRAIDPDTRIVVTTRPAGVVTGRFLGADTVALTIDRGDRIEQIPSDAILDVTTVSRHIGRGAGIGAALGGGLGTALVMAKAGSGDENGFYRAVGSLPILAAGGIGLGIAVGVRESTTVVYRAATAVP
jgi:hypothetical protein